VPVALSAKPLALVLERFGGTIQIEYDRPLARTSKTPALYLIHGTGGHTFVEGPLKSWAEANQLVAPDRGDGAAARPLLLDEGRTTIEVPQMARGSYALCWMTTPAELRFLHEQILPKECARGMLEPFSTLQLSVARVED
jgi:hypothetical protein